MAIIAEGMVRVTASLSRALEQALKDLAPKHNVSVACLVSYAVERGCEARLLLDFARRG